MNDAQKLNLICDTVDNGIILLDKDLQVHYWNNWLETRTNISSVDIKNKKLQEYFPAINKKTLIRKINTAINLNSPTFYNPEINEFLLNIELNKVTNKIFNFMRQAVTITPYDKEQGLVIVYIYDTTLLCEINHTLESRNKKLKQSKHKLKEEINKIELLLDATMDAMFVFEDDTCINVNNLGIELFACKNKEELLGKEIYEFLKNNEDLALSKYHNKAFESYLIDKNGNSFPALIKIKQTMQNENQIRIMSIVDLTELKAKDKLIAEQAKLAALGDMIGNIAHQWRQPLSTISTAATGIKLLREYDSLEEKDLDSSLDGIIKSSKYLSKTIDDFRDFLQGDKEKTTFNLETNIKKDLSILDGMLKDSDIQIIENYIQEIEIYSFNNELTQAIINILSNAKDAFSINNIKERYIFITTNVKNNNAIVEIKDNAGGISDDIINKIFEPYFTTKHKSLGTGLGLYMTQQIIKQNIQGSIEVQNETYKFNNEEFTGASFIIQIPLYTKTTDTH